ncbi:TerD family protein [Moraxella sp. ZJ142]|uniref:TerD family protein n=1 Tax=Moraxella marmotae TaxID=3344520 RepID=UPI0035D4AF35
MPSQTDKLKKYFEPIKLGQTELGNTLLVGLNYQFSQPKKQGLAAMLAKLPLPIYLLRQKTLAVDVDLSCFVLDKKQTIIETIWYGNLRNASQSIRHQGDALIGAKSFADALLPQEQILLKMDKTPDAAHQLIFVLSSYHNQPLKTAEKGMAYFGDKEKPKCHSVDFGQVDDDCQSLVLWQMTRCDSDWQLSSPMYNLGIKKLTGKSIDTLTSAVNDYVQSQQRW